MLLNFYMLTACTAADSSESLLRSPHDNDITVMMINHAARENTGASKLYIAELEAKVILEQW